MITVLWILGIILAVPVVVILCGGLLAVGGSDLNDRQRHLLQRYRLTKKPR